MSQAEAHPRHTKEGWMGSTPLVCSAVKIKMWVMSEREEDTCVLWGCEWEEGHASAKSPNEEDM